MQVTSPEIPAWDGQVIGAEDSAMSPAAFQLVPDWDNRIIDCNASITDIVAFHKDLRVLEASPLGMRVPVIHTFRAIDVGGGGSFYALDLLNGWRLRFPQPGNYVITGNVGAEVIGVPGVFVMQTKALAFATTSATGAGGGTSGPSATEIADAVLNAPAATYNRTGTIGRLINLVLTLPKFLAYRDENQ
jgi:hypothetical protein